jgi:hypothetical protein
MTMFGERIYLRDIKERLLDQFAAAYPSVNVARVGTIYERDYLKAYPITAPAVWVAGQNLTPIDKGDGYSSQFRQRCAVELGIRIVVKRYENGNTDPEVEMTTLFKAVAGSLKDWTPPNAESPFVWRRSNDGPGNDSVFYSDLYFSTDVLYTRTSP